MFPSQIVVEIELILCTLGEPFVFFFLALVLFGGWHGWLRIAHGLHLVFFLSIILGKTNRCVGIWRGVWL
jgi:hypothetical protein